MTIDRRSFSASMAAALAVGPLVSRAVAQAPQPLKGTGRVYAGFPAGGTLDQTARRLAESIRGEYPDGIIVENRVGAGGRLAVEAIKGAQPDGLALLVTPDSVFTIYPTYYKKLSYDPIADASPISPVVSFPFAFAISPKVPAGVRTLAQFVDWVKKNPADAAYGHPSTGSVPHFQGNEFNRIAGTGMRHVPYRGSAPLLQDLVGGHVACGITVLGDFLPHLSSGNIRMLAVTTAKRSKFMPDVPTFAEAGFQVVGGETYGLFLPGKAPAALQDRFAALVAKAATDPAVIKALEAIGMEMLPMKPAEYRDYLDKERAKWGPIVKASGFSADD